MKLVLPIILSLLGIFLIGFQKKRVWFNPLVRLIVLIVGFILLLWSLYLFWRINYWITISLLIIALFGFLRGLYLSKETVQIRNILNRYFRFKQNMPEIDAQKHTLVETFKVMNIPNTRIQFLANLIFPRIENKDISIKDLVHYILVNIEFQNVNMYIAVDYWVEYDLIEMLLRDNRDNDAAVIAQAGTNLSLSQIKNMIIRIKLRNNSINQYLNLK